MGLFEGGDWRSVAEGGKIEVVRRGYFEEFLEDAGGRLR